ncbi:MAG: amidohydrolase family protein [Pirellulales bacterium]|nr:amidohydrolase family protein [Pirellulales bacterium]
MSLHAFRARWVIPVDGSPVDGGIVSIDQAQIVGVGRATDTRWAGVPVEDLGDVALLPGLINAHTHLEFSDCSSPLGAAGMALPAWIAQVIEHRRSMLDHRAETTRQGLQESLRAGVTTLGEIATAGWDPTAFDAAVPAAVVFYELIGLGPARLAPNLELARRHLATPGTYVAGLSPHAPYTVHPELLAGLVDLAVGAGAPIAMHLAESREELDLLADQRGAFVELISSLGAWFPDAIPRSTRPLDYLQQLARASRSLVIHGNYLDDEAIAFAARQSERMSVVYCPRTHAYFAHERYPLTAMLAAGVRVALGTDGRGSNPDLSLLAEMRHVARTFPELAPDVVIRLGTIEGAQALGLAGNRGTLEPGKRADLIALPTRAATPRAAVAEILAGDQPVGGVMLAGCWARDPRAGNS